MKVVSIDIETTGLNPETDQILEVGAVLFDTATPVTAVENLPSFHCLVKHDRYEGDAYALAMNAGILKKLSSKDTKEQIINVQLLAWEFKNWLENSGAGDMKNNQAFVTLAGKNVAAFDYQFLRRVHNWNKFIRVGHRMLDPGMLYFLPIGDAAMPSIDICCTRAELNKQTKHDALGDARVIVQLLNERFHGVR